MNQTGLIVKKNSNIIHTHVFSGDTTKGILDFKADLEGLNSSTTFTYGEYDSEATEFTSAVIDTAERDTVTFRD